MNWITTRSLAATPAQAGVVTVPAPSPDFLPGSTQLSNLVAGVEYLALLVLVAAMAWFAVEWAIAQHTNNPYHTQSGKVGFMRAAGAAVLVGSASALIDFFFRVGGQIR
ncbi:MAG: hypothetical protein E6J41_26460 [Chloroflexi bacterium]|nr:MAG: hypothetical protein E6J41_26460 [Chloroflexota bacterium]